MSIALNHITLSYGSRTLLEDVTAAFAQGSLTALIGRNGTGKSTLLRAIAGLGTTVSGDVALCGRPLASLTPHELSTTVGFVTTDKVRIANLACEDVVALGRAPYTNWIGRMQEADRAVVERSLRLVGLWYGSCQVNRCVPNLRSLRRTACRGLLCLPAAAAHYLAYGISRTVRRSVCLKYERLIMKEIWIRLKFARRCTPCPGALW